MFTCSTAFFKLASLLLFYIGLESHFCFLIFYFVLQKQKVKLLRHLFLKKHWLMLDKLLKTHIKWFIVKSVGRFTVNSESFKHTLFRLMKYITASLWRTFQIVLTPTWLPL